ncbi:MAG: hypothetical protein ACXW1Y_00790, partial [Acidimicrobiia bacterium]
MARQRRSGQNHDVSARLRRLVILFGVTGLVFVAIAGWIAWTAYRDIDRVTFGDVVAAAENLATIPVAEVEELRAAEDAVEDAVQTEDPPNLDGDV